MNFLQQEDEVDFMPIIPFNENEGDGTDDTLILCCRSGIPFFFQALSYPLPLEGTSLSRPSQSRTKLTNW